MNFLQHKLKPDQMAGRSKVPKQIMMKKFMLVAAVQTLV